MEEEEPKLRSERLRMATKQVHDKSDRLVNLKLTLALTSRQLYGEALGLFAPVYEFLESALHDDKRHVALKPLSDLLQDVRRAPKFHSDMQFYLGEEFSSPDKSSKKSKELDSYLQHLKALEREDPLLLVPYIYHMYMALLAGGVVIKRMVQTTLRLDKSSTKGVECLSFSDIDTRALKKQLKQYLNETIELTPLQEERFLEESKQLFELNNRLVGTLPDSSSYQAIMKRYKQVAGIGLVIGIAVFSQVWARQPKR